MDSVRFVAFIGIKSMNKKHGITYGRILVLNRKHRVYDLSFDDVPELFREIIANSHRIYIQRDSTWRHRFECILHHFRRRRQDRWC